MSDIRVLLADDDPDDNLLFNEVMEELPYTTELAVMYNGEQLLQYLRSIKDHLPDILFLDLNMPLKNGFDCLVEIRKDKDLRKIPVIIYTTSSAGEIVNQLYDNGATYFIQKPNTFDELKQVINQAISFSLIPDKTQPPMAEFVLPTQSRGKGAK